MEDLKLWIIYSHEICKNWSTSYVYDESNYSAVVVCYLLF